MSERNSNWSRPERRFKRHCGGNRPPYLRGKQIGLYYKNLAKNNPDFAKLKKEKVINLKVPSSVLKCIHNNLKSIAQIAKLHNIDLLPVKKISDLSNYTSKEEIDCLREPWLKEHMVLKTCTLLPQNMSDTSFEAKMNIEQPVPSSELFEAKIKIEQPDTSSELIEPKIKIEQAGPSSELIETKIKIEPSSSSELIETNIKIEQPGPSSELDFIPVEDSEQDYGIGDEKLYFRRTREYKYGYQDIITGTFEEKLIESLESGVKICKHTSDTTDISLALQTEYNDMILQKEYCEMLKFREKLPAYKKSAELLEVINNNQVIVISGETGCGKSTQVPQMILDNAIRSNRGANVNIIVTQPRRIAASSLAMRVSEERAERVGNSVGYAVRLDKVDPRPRGSIIFVTTGVLLVELETNQGLTNFSHIILDEVHERDSHIDIAMCMLKQVLSKREDMKLILMSATLDAERLSAYFDNCPMVHIEGLAYPVKDIYLEEILELTHYKLKEKQTRKYHSKPKWKQIRDGKKASSQEMQRDIQYKAEIGSWLESIKRNLSKDVYRTLQDARIEDLNIELIHTLLVHICASSGPGAILVFLPGIGEISKLIKMMDDSSVFPQSRYDIFALHSKLPALDQHKIFARPCPGIRKIIVATNIAETSITIDDVVYVIDCAKMKISGLNVEKNISTLSTVWVSQANLRQRRGRAGRCQPGICYHLLTSYRAQKLDERVLPDLQRSNLLEPVLAIKKLRLGKAANAFSMVLDPPALASVNWAVKHLQQCGALDDSETLTPLGWHMARLPVHPAAGKLLVLGCMFGCIDRAASVAAVWGFKDPYMLVLGKEQEIKQIKRQLTLSEPSDHIALSEALMLWEQYEANSNGSTFAYDHYLSNSTLKLLSEMKHQLAGNLKDMGFLSSGNLKSSWENRNTKNSSLFKAIVAASLYPNIGTVRWKCLDNPNPTKIVRLKANTPEDGAIKIHPSSALSTHQGDKSNFLRHVNGAGANWFVYWMKQKSTELYVFEITLVYTLPLLFFGELRVSDAEESDECYISITSVKVRCKRETADVLIELRSLLDQVLASKIMTTKERSSEHSEFEELVLNTVIALITAEDENASYINDDEDESDASEYGETSSHSGWRNH